MARIFLSHSSVNNAEAIAIRDWMKAQGWDDVFLDVDPEQGLAAGDAWQTVLPGAIAGCELVVVLISPDWVASSWGKAEFLLTKHGRSPKAILPVVVQETPIAKLPIEMRADYHLVDLTAGLRSVKFVVKPPGSESAVEVAFSADGLRALKAGLIRHGVAADYFEWPPPNDPNRPPYRGLRPLEADDASVFFGRNAPIGEALGQLRAMREGAPPRLLVILGASGAGKSSFLRAGLLPRLLRDDRHFLPLRVIRPGRSVLSNQSNESGESGLLVALEEACLGQGLRKARADIKKAIDGGADRLRPLLQMLVDGATPRATKQEADDIQSKPVMLVFPIDQGEELFHAEGQDEAKTFLALLKDLLTSEAPAAAAIITIRSDAYERLQLSEELQGVRLQTLSLSPMPKGSYIEVINGPPRRLAGTPRAFKIEASLVERLLADIEDGSNKDALPLLAFTLERLYVDYGSGGDLKLSHYLEGGGIHGSIEAAVKRAFKAADADSSIPRDTTERLALLRRGLIPWIAGVDPDSGAPRRRVARMGEIPAESRRLVELLIDQRLLATDIADARDPATGVDNRIVTIEPAHETLLRQWDELRNWLVGDRELLIVMDNVKRAARDWNKYERGAAWLTHEGARLQAAQKLNGRPDIAAGLDQADQDYLTACASAEAVAKRRTRGTRAALGALAFSVVAGALAWHYEAYLKDGVHWITVVRPYIAAQVQPYVLAAAAERALKPGDSFRECAKDAFCPDMIVAPAGEFMMGSPDTEPGRFANEGPQHRVAIPRPFAVSEFDVTFDDWDACVSIGGCPDVDDSTYGRERKPVINVTWVQAQQYVAWLGRMTGKPYRLLTEAEWEYVARAGATTAYSWGDDVGAGQANCVGCGSKWDKVETSPVGSFPPNPFGLYDMAGDVWQWVQDCTHRDYGEAPTDGSEWTGGDCNEHIVRGGSWLAKPPFLRSAFRAEFPPEEHNTDIGFRVARSLAP
jgi:formylglycine-generating enzyme required for sulfatase activity